MSLEVLSQCEEQLWKLCASLGVLPFQCTVLLLLLLLQSTAIQIAGLKQLNKGMTVYIMDNKGSACKAGQPSASHAAPGKTAG